MVGAGVLVPSLRFVIGTYTSDLQGKTEAEAEEYFVNFLESWREVLSLKDFYIAGHSLGGYIACLYAMKYPEKVKGMLLLEPWGFFDAPEASTFSQLFLVLCLSYGHHLD